MAWTTLYTTMGIASYLVYSRGWDNLQDNSWALTLYAAQVRPFDRITTLTVLILI